MGRGHLWCTIACAVLLLAACGDDNGGGTVTDAGADVIDGSGDVVDGGDVGDTGRCGDGTVDDGEECDDSGESAGCNLDCTTAMCGDGKVNSHTTPAEQCDDTNGEPGDGCTDCHFEHCGNGVVDSGEQCDGAAGAGPYGCSADCYQIECGNGRADPGEGCDDGNQSDDDNCLSSDTDPATCVPSSCGDGVRDGAAPGIEECDNGVDNGYTDACLPGCLLNVCGDGFTLLTGDSPEACDDGNTDNETECPYGSAFCTACNDDCSGVFSLTGPFCGDGDTDGGFEECDDGNTQTEDSCPYGTPTCNVCDAACALVPQTGSVCGDGVVNDPYEACDDGNATCGTCSADCRAVQAPAIATGLIVAVPAITIADGDSFTISDGLGTTIVFEFTFDGVVSGWPLQIAAGDDASDVAVEIRTSINQSPLRMNATQIGPGATGTVVRLDHQVATALGNVPITTSGVPEAFYVSGMSGGAARDCGPGDACASDDDCVSGSCSAGTCAP